MANLLEKLRQLFARQKYLTEQKTMNNPTGASAPNTPPEREPILTEEMVADLMRQIEKTQEGMYSCAESFALLDEYVDMISSGEDAARLMPLVKAHLDVCPDCHEAYDMLRSVIQTDTPPTSDSIGTQGV